MAAGVETVAVNAAIYKYTNVSYTYILYLYFGSQMLPLMLHQLQFDKEEKAVKCCDHYFWSLPCQGV